MDMDRHLVNALRNRAFAIESLIAPTQALLNELTTDQPAARISARIGIEAGVQESVYLIEPTAIGWPPEMFVQAACAGAEPELQQFLSLAQPISKLYHASAKASSIIGSFFGTATNQQAVLAAEELQVRLENPVLTELEQIVKTHLSTAQTAKNQQTAGVYLQPGVHGYPDSYIVAAREAITRELGLAAEEHVSFDTLDRNYIVPTHTLVDRKSVV